MAPRISVRRFQWVLNRVKLDDSIAILVKYPRSTRAKMNVQAARNICLLDRQDQADLDTKKWVREQSHFIHMYGWDCWMENLEGPINSVWKRQ